MKLYLVRHGQSTGNVDKSEYFKTPDSDIELTELGKVQIKISAERILDFAGSSFFGNIFYSPYKRAKQSADIIDLAFSRSINSHAIINYEMDVRLREREWGELRDIVNRDMKTEGHFNFFYTPFGGESFANCYDRVASFHQWIMCNYPQTDTIVVAHGEFLKLYAMFLMRWELNEFEKWKTPRNGEVMLFEDNPWRLSDKTPLTEKTIKH